MQVKYLLLGHNILPEGIAAHLVASLLAGLAVATTTNPVSNTQPVPPSPQLQVALTLDLGKRVQRQVGSAWLGALSSGRELGPSFQG